jgi:hypothetical protein
LDKDEDGKVTPEEFAAVGVSGLPSFDDIGAEGHHYDVESGEYFTNSAYSLSLSSRQEFFLHHEGLFEAHRLLSQFVAQRMSRTISFNA